MRPCDRVPGLAHGGVLVALVCSSPTGDSVRSGGLCVFPLFCNFSLRARARRQRARASRLRQEDPRSFLKAGVGRRRVVRFRFHRGRLCAFSQVVRQVGKHGLDDGGLHGDVGGRRVFHGRFLTVLVVAAR